MGDEGLASTGVAMKPKDARGVFLSTIDPGSNFVKDFSASALQTDFLGIESCSTNVGHVA